MAMADYTIDKYFLMNIGPKSCIHKFPSNWYNFTWRLEKPTKPENLFANVKTYGKNVIISQTLTKLDNLNTRYYLSNGAGFEDEVLKDATRRVIMDRNVSKVSKHAKCAFMFRVHHVTTQNTQCTNQPNRQPTNNPQWIAIATPNRMSSAKDRQKLLHAKILPPKKTSTNHCLSVFRKFWNASCGAWIRFDSACCDLEEIV